MEALNKLVKFLTPERQENEELKEVVRYVAGLCGIIAIIFALGFSVHYFGDKTVVVPPLSQPSVKAKAPPDRPAKRKAEVASQTPEKVIHKNDSSKRADAAQSASEKPSRQLQSFLKSINVDPQHSIDFSSANDADTLTFLPSGQAEIIRNVRLSRAQVWVCDGSPLADLYYIFLALTRPSIALQWTGFSLESDDGTFLILVSLNIALPKE